MCRTLLGIRFQNGAERGTYIIQYRIGSKQRRLSLGKVGKITLKQAKVKAKTYFGQIVDKVDPAIARAKAIAKASKGIEALIEPFLTYLETDKRRAPSYIQENRRSLERYFKRLHQFAPDDVDRETVAVELRKISTEHGPIAANRSRAHLSKFFNWLIGEGHVSHNPAYGTNKADENVRDGCSLPPSWQRYGRPATATSDPTRSPGC